MSIVLFLPIIEPGKEVRIVDAGIGEERKGKMGKMSLSGIKGDVPFERAVAREVCRFLDSTKVAEVLGTIGLLVTQNLAKSTHDVSKCRIRHWWFREESFVRGGDCRR